MGTPYVGEIRMFGGNFAPVGWAFCSGQLLAIAENDVLFSLIGTTYGGDGQSTFAVPDLRGRLPVHAGSGPGLSPRSLGGSGGQESVALTLQQIPSHQHPLMAAAGAANSAAPSNTRALATVGGNQFYATGTSRGFSPVSMSNNAVGNVGGNQPHDNVQPFLCVNYIISLFGIYPSEA